MFISVQWYGIWVTYLPEVVLIGNATTGKSQIFRAMSSIAFTDAWKTTIGVDFVPLYWMYRRTAVKIVLWDTGGHPKYQSVVSS